MTPGPAVDPMARYKTQAIAGLLSLLVLIMSGAVAYNWDRLGRFERRLGDLEHLGGERAPVVARLVADVERLTREAEALRDRCGRLETRVDLLGHLPPPPSPATLRQRALRKVWPDKGR